MARQQHHRNDETTQQTWGTLEELLLACAVNRHGTKSWDSILMEIQNRTSSLPLLTSQNCKDKFKDLRRRFTSNNDTDSIINQLRQIRVQELRHEVQRHDDSIVSLEMKLKKLEEERERNLKEGTDLHKEGKSSPGNLAGKSAAGDEYSGDERDNRSFNESNSTSQQKVEAETLRQQNDVQMEAKPDFENGNGKDPVVTRSDPFDNEKEWPHSDNSYDNKNKNHNNKIKALKKEGEKTPSEGELGGESVEKEKQNNSDVQSSASLSQYKYKKKQRPRGGGGGGGGGGAVENSSGDEREGGDEVSPATNKKTSPAVKSEPLLKLISTIRAHRHGSAFESTLRSQESERYKKLIRQHMDLRTIQSRLDKGAYSTCIVAFFRDLLLLFNNAIIFFKKNSSESIAAFELRALVLKEMAERLRKPVKPEPKTTAKIEPKQQSASFSKPSKTSSTIVVCGKGHSKKATGDNASKKVDKKEKEVQEKPKADEKKMESSFAKIEGKGIRKQRTKDRSISSNRNSSNTSNKNAEVKHQFGGNELSSHDTLETKVEKKGNTAKKKQGAASFLKRMKQNSPGEITDNDDGADNNNDDASEGSSEEESKDNKGKVEKGKRKGNDEGDKITERVTRSSRGRGAREESGRGKKTSGGRSAKKQPEKGESGGGKGKRGRENGGSVEGGSSRARKRSRR